MNKYGLFSDRHFGFFGGRSTGLQLLKVLDHWTEILDNEGSIDAIYTDCMKAFDKVPHKRLINKLRSYGISNQTCNWVQSFLNDDQNYIEIYIVQQDIDKLFRWSGKWLLRFHPIMQSAANIHEKRKPDGSTSAHDGRNNSRTVELRKMWCKLILA
ncbi:Hypothetical predicted protein [Mytilus galloprovincialis]|uniref:Reverse transcriptase domain-containing protein n=1 Tax=Mytilus galloprovincialis TaxID=29158 RepID=A0A8B6FWP0_MYTGA|nr:Hypothetical predicted protein [Mytilus galloprovincialis]